MTTIDPELWILVHGGLKAAEEWPTGAHLAVVRALLRTYFDLQKDQSQPRTVWEEDLAGKNQQAMNRVLREWANTDTGDPQAATLVYSTFSDLPGAGVLPGGPQYTPLVRLTDLARAIRDQDLRRLALWTGGWIVGGNRLDHDALLEELSVWLKEDPAQ